MDTKVNNLDDRLAARLREERQARGWSMAELADRSGVSRAMIGKVEKGEASPTAALLGKLAAAFDLSLSTLLARAEGVGGALIRRDAQPIWRDPETGYHRRAVTPPGQGGAEIVEVDLPPGARVDYPAASYASSRHKILVLDGVLTFHDSDGAHRLISGDLYAIGPASASAYENADDAPCRYLVIQTRP